MKIINRERGGGKTYALIELMLAPGNEDVIYVAPTKTQAINVGYETARRISPGVDRGRFISVQELQRAPHVGRYPVPRFVLDEVEGVLASLIPGKVLAIAGTDEDLRAGQIRRIRGER